MENRGFDCELIMSWHLKGMFINLDIRTIQGRFIMFDFLICLYIFAPVQITQLLQIL